MFSRFFAKLRAIRRIPREVRILKEEVDCLRTEIEYVRSRIDVDEAIFHEFQCIRKSKEYQKVYSLEKPLVTVCVGTFNRGNLLNERCLKSILNQSYSNIEVIVVGDGCTDNTEQLMANIHDSRVTFINLPERGCYPDEPFLRWMVAGTQSINHALSLATGDFITHLDDDDEYDVERIEKLLNFIKSTRADFLWHPFWAETQEGKWVLNQGKEFKLGYVTTSSIFYHNWFKKIPWDINAYKYREPGDWNRLRKVKYLAANIARFPDPLLKHYKERNQKA